MSRLGKPDVSEATEEELNILIEASKTPEIDILYVSGFEVVYIGEVHDLWYSNNTRVSSGVLMSLLFNASPLERGLEEHWFKDRSKAYRFPSD
ncbi:MAG: hypothetical protein ACI8PB_002259 [Desulforhopalus sp.]|jgi:hypothetical protein